MKLSSQFAHWLQNDKTSVSKSSAYWELHDKTSGWADFKSAYPAAFNNRAKEYKDLPQKMPDIVRDAEYTESFTCSGSHKLVSSVEYDPKRMVMKITWDKSLSGKRGAYPKGSSATAYDHVPQYVFDYLKDINTNLGHVGKEVWTYLRGRGTGPAGSNDDTSSLYPYTNGA